MRHAYDPELLESAADLPVGADLEAHIRSRPQSPPPYSAGSRLDGVFVRTVRAPVTADDTSVRVDVFDPAEASEESRPALLYLPGGGFVIEPQPGIDRAIARTAAILDVPVAMVRYRLAPEHPFPAALRDAEATFDWLHGQGERIGISPERIGLLGDSAGGGIAASLALRLRDRGGVQPIFQHLTMPMLDRRAQTASMQEFEDTPLWTGASARRAWSFYLPDGVERSPLAPYASPALAEDVAGLPATRIVTCEFDPLRDEGIAYGIRLIEAGVPTELHHYPGTFHGSALVTGAEISRRMNRDRIEALQRHLNRAVSGRSS